MSASANPPSPAEQAIAPFSKRDWKCNGIGISLAGKDPEDTFLSATVAERKGAVLLAPFEKGGRHRAAMTGGFALRTPHASSAL